MPGDAGKSVSAFLAALKAGEINAGILKDFLAVLGSFPLELPLLKGLGAFFSNGDSGLIMRKMESRYRRIAFVQESLGKIDFSRAKPGIRFEDFMFDQSDFSIYRKIDAETFSLLYIQGLDDLADTFFGNTIPTGKTETRKIIAARYKLSGDAYISDGNPLLIPIMRSIHTCLDFKPFPDPVCFRNELESLFEFLERDAGLPGNFYSFLAREEDDVYAALLKLFDKAEIFQQDRTATRFRFGEENGNAALFAVFHPGGKAFTKLMSVSNVPFGELR